MNTLPVTPRAQPRLVGWLLAALALLVSASATAGSLDAAAAQRALERGAVAWDLRAAPQALLPGAVRVDPAAVDAWLDRGDVPALAAAVSKAGLNLSGEVLVYGDAADPRVQQVVERLARVSRGRVHELAGGFSAWTAAGLPVADRAAVRLPVPQRLLVIDEATPAQPADASRRLSVNFKVDAAAAHVAARTVY